MQRRAIRHFAGLTIFALTLVACGQKPGAHVDNFAAPQPGGQVVDNSGTGEVFDSTGDAGGTTDASFSDTTGDASSSDTTGGSTTGGTTSGGTTGGSTTGGSTTGGTTSGGTTSGGSSTGGTTSGGSTAGATSTTGGTTGKRQVKGSDRTGVTADTIFLAGHAPVTGAAPLPTTSFEKGLDLYWVTQEDKGVFPLGRKVDMQFRDDKYDPNSARQVCRELEAKVFTMSGGGGTDQIQACGQLASVAKFPYTSAGVTEAGLKGNPWYFATSMTYRQQGLLLAQMVKKYHPGKKSAFVVTDTPNFDDAIDGWMQGVQQQGLPYYDTLKHPKGDTSWYNSFAKKLQDNDVEVVYILSSPLDYIRLAQQADQQGYKPQYVGVGISMGLNAVLGSGCPQVDKGQFLSPFPGVDWARANLPEFISSGQKHNKPTDDISLALWANNAIAHELFNRYEAAYGTDLTREDFRDLAESSTGIKTGVFPDLSYSPTNHFGAKQAHLLEADCGPKEYKTLETFKSSF